MATGRYQNRRESEKVMNELQIPPAQTEWKDILLGGGSEEQFIIVLTVIGCATAVIIVLSCVFASVWSSVKHKRLEAELKQDMLDRGMSAEEIEQVIEATPKEGIDSWIASWKKSK
jgi:hypothetical protein